MLTIIHGLLHHHSKWRDIKMSELSELYLSNTLKTFAISLISIFVPIYLYELGYSLTDILFYFLIFFTVRPLLDLSGGYFVARFGPKHVMRASYMTTLLSLAMLVTLDQTSWPLWSIAITQSLGWSYYWLSFHTDFSKIKHTKSEGKELGVMTILSRLVSVFGPLAGGAIALATGIQFVFMLAVIVMFMATVPLMMTPEPTKVNQPLNIHKLKLRPIKRDLITIAGMSADAVSFTALWPLFIALAVFGVDESVYANVGFVTSISLIVGVLMVKAMGTLVDKDRGKELLEYSAMATAVLHALRPLVTTQIGVVLINIASEPPFNGTRLPYTKGLYERADTLGDLRIAYLTVAQMTIAICRVFLIAPLWILSMHHDEILVLQLGMLAAAVITPLVLLQKFPALEKK